MWGEDARAKEGNSVNRFSVSATTLTALTSFLKSNTKFYFLKGFVLTILLFQFCPSVLLHAAVMDTATALIFTTCDTSVPVIVKPCDCTSDSVEIYIPNAVSPNGDSQLDHFTIFGKCITQLDEKVFDRWGNLMYQSTDPTEINDYNGGWDFNISATMVAGQGTFIYQISVKNACGAWFSKVGTFVLLR
jgi:hypothetical protein